MKKTLLTIAMAVVGYCSYGQSQVTTTGNNIINPSNPYAADIVIGSDAGTRHDGSMMWWSNSSASRISNTADVFYMSVWNTITPNIALSATVGGSSYFQGNVGIGTTTPSQKLEINGNIYLNNGLNGNGQSGTQLIFNNTFGTTGPNKIVLYNDGASWEGGLGIKSNTVTLHSGGNFQFYNGTAPGTDGIPTMTVLSSGNVGIGTTTPDQLLSVAGTIHSKEVKVDLIGWPDYVFKPAYHLPSLTDVKTYIDQNHHLPDMPSEQDVAKDGLDLGEMNKLLTQKVEELTLYLIDLKKENETLKQEQKIINRKLKRNHIN